MGQSDPMGEDVASRTFTREDRQRYRDKVHRCLDVLARMLAEERFDFDTPADRHGGRAQPRRRRRATRRCATPRSSPSIDDPAFVQELGRFNLEINVPPQSLAGDGAAPVRGRGARPAQRRRRPGPRGRRRDGDDRHPARRCVPEHMTHESISSNPRYALLDEQMLLARGEDLHIDIRGRPGVARDLRRLDRPGGRVHERAVPPAGQPRRVRATSWNAAQCLAAVAGGARRELAVLPGPRAVARDPDRAVHPGHRHPARRAEGAGRAAAGVVRGALDHQRLRPVRGEPRRTSRRCCRCIDDEDPVAVLDAGRHARAARAAPAQRHGLALEPPGLRRRRRADRTCGWRTGCCPPGPTVVDIAGQRRASTSARCGVLAEQERPVWSQMSFGAAEENFTPAAIRGMDASVYWPGMRRGPGQRAGAAPAAPAGPRGAAGVGGRRRDPRAAARASSRAAAPPGATARRGRSTPCTPSRRAAWTAGRRCAG